MLFLRHKKEKKVDFATLMDICHHKNVELEPKHQKYKRRVVLRGDIVKYDFGAYAVLNHGQALKIPWFLLNEICVVTHLLD